MSRGERVLVCVLGLAAIAAIAWAQPTVVVSVPVSGQYWESGAGGLLNYSGVMTITWQADAAGNGEWPVSASFVGQAWCVNTGAGYSLVGICTDCIKASAGTSQSVTKSFTALDGQGQPVFEGLVSLAFTLPARQGPPVVTAVAFGR